MNRRSFFQATLTAFGAIALYTLSAQSGERKKGGVAAAGALALVDPNSSTAKAVHYAHSGKDIKDKALQTDRSGVKFSAQKCHSCVFYNKDKESKVAGKLAGPCQMPFASGKVVAADGWCTSWAKKS